MDSIYIGLDLGTSVVKGLAMNDEGKTLAFFSKETPLISRKPSWVEQSPELWWSTTLEILNLIATKIDPKNVKGIGLSGQMHGLVAYDNNLSILKRAITWLDKRSYLEVEEILDKVGRSKIYKITGNPIFTGFLLSSLLWTKKNEPELYKKIHKVSSPKDYLAYKMTGALQTEPTDALATGAFDYTKNDWSDKIIKLLEINRDIFIKSIPTTKPYGGISKKVAKITGLKIGTPVYGGSDQAMAALGSGVINEGDAALAVSTGGQFLAIAKKGMIDPKRRLHTLNHITEDIGLYMAATLSAGLSLRWFKDFASNHKELTYQDFIKGIKDVDIGSGGIYFLPYLAGERTPYFNADLKAAFFGLAINHNHLHMIRAIIEGVSYSMKDCYSVFNQLNLPIKRIVLSGGGAADVVWRQVLCDVINKPMQTINIENHSPFGAAVLAKIAQEGIDKLPLFYEKAIRVVDFLYPNEKNAKRYEELFLGYKYYSRFLNTKSYK